MQLIKSKWNKTDIETFITYLKTFKRTDEKCKWEKGIVNTSYECLAILSKDIKEISRTISKGNFISFLDLQIYNNFPAITIMGNLICKIKEFSQMKYYLDLYSEHVDNWANCDQLKFKITNENCNQFLNLVNEYINSPLPFRRRIAIIILFQFINENHVDKIFKLANSINKEKDYYVNMAMAWLLCECFIKLKKQTLTFLKTHTLNSFTLNKMISKCCDSYRVSNEDKILLKTLKAK